MVRSLFLVVLGVASALGASSDCKVKEAIVPPRNWIKHSVPPANHVIELKIALPQPNFAELERHLYEVSDPDHVRYGDHLSKQEVDSLVAPNPESVSAVTEWLESHGIQDKGRVFSSAKDWVTIKVPVSLAEKMLDTTYHVWKHTGSDDHLVRTTSYSLPEHLHEHIVVVQPTTMFAQLSGMKSTIRWSDTSKAVTSVTHNALPIADPVAGTFVDPTCPTNITLNCLRQLYNAVGFKPSAKGNSIGITGYLEQFANLADLQQFYAEQNPAALNSSFKFVSVKGGLNNQTLSEAGAEADLDVQFAFGLSFPISSTFFSTAGRPPFIPDSGTPTDTNEPYLDWLGFILEQEKPPLAISTSYGDDEQTVPKDFAVRACQEFAKLGARGVSLMFSSGDGGVGDGDPDPATQSCFTNDGLNQTKFIPGFPASCPFVTAVGGTVNIPETAVDFSGGGFSNYFARPAYQDAAVASFFKKLPKGTYAGLFNPQGRGIPDVSAQSDFFRIFFQGQAVHIGGTSASSPAFTGFVALLNDARLSAGKKSLGFLNPLLYSKAVSGFNDITTGNAPGCGTPGFNATAGWDPVTGLGTPNFAKLKQIVTAPGLN
ncbi:tripeptidyl peptidase A [Mycena floridula]|nr:tripeptidyl peptidase A [Mycena floridula]